MKTGLAVLVVAIVVLLPFVLHDEWDVVLPIVLVMAIIITIVVGAKECAFSAYRFRGRSQKC